MCGLGTWELLIVLAIVVLIFGASRLPQLGKALGETVRNFKKGQSGPEPVADSKKKQESIEGKEAARLSQAVRQETVEDAELEDEKVEKPG
jgi:sec-independent protein translocase protein TatA